MDSIPFEKVSIQALRTELAREDEQAKKKEAKMRWEHLRATETAVDRELQPATFKWMARLPVSVRPFELAKQYPRVANKMTIEWLSPTRREAYLKHLLTDTRGTRKGFPLEIIKELARLGEFGCPWNGKITRDLEFRCQTREPVAQLPAL